MRSLRPGALLVCVLATLLSSCGSTGPTRKRRISSPEVAGIRCIFDSQDLYRQKLKPGPGFARTSEGELLVQVTGNIRQVRGWVPISSEDLEEPIAFATDSENTLYLVSGKRFGILIGGLFTVLTELPANGFRISVAAPDRIFLHGPAPDRSSVVFLLRRKTDGATTIQQVMVLKGAIAALLPVGEDFLLAQENRIYRAGWLEKKRFGALLYMALDPGQDVRDLAIDETRGTLFISTDARTLAVHDGVVAPILDMGGILATAGEGKDTLYLYQPSQGRAFEINLPRLFSALVAPPTPPDR